MRGSADGGDRAPDADTHVDRFSVPVDTRAPGGTTNAYVVGTDETLLVDPAARTDTLDTVVREKVADHVAVTHAHPDHVGAVADYAAETGAAVWARRGYEDRFADATGVEPDRSFGPGDRVGPATVLDLPGHAPDGVGFETGNGVVCGDVAVAEGSVVVAAPEGDMRAYLTTLRRLHARDPPALFPGHGPRIDDPKAVSARLVDHRLDRERTVLAAVEAGADDLDAILDRAYEKDLTGVWDLARATVRAHVEKLARAGRVHWDPTDGSVGVTDR
ncbi:MBL fold metallo-hydrolase [Halobaculum gomorrense]|uniref:Glyoxylase, beta-lactamase superfamily II n=1 Tax=Halobaculum gomorrense TaxID=43928 RepID=A0A1M5KUE4_9EURY|nr:MBL fold metallo-hydrolase [Halobaculum gomorrense]SHG56388.1 Glyoxylase, beta-lactamase superfamily II [Halobaculum gomorrense]